MADPQDTQIPVFTVWKNNAILKNIFLINSAPDTHQQVDEHSKTQIQNDVNFKTHQRFEATLLVGRHPDCDIRLENPSISRFHLRIHSNPASKNLSITDLSSVHGTYVSGRKLEPNVRTTLNESDTLRIGESSRVYKLYWIPLSKAYDVSDPFVPPLDLAAKEDGEDEEIVKDECSLGLDKEAIQAVDTVSKGIKSGEVCDNGKLVVEQVSQVTEQNVSPEKNKCTESKSPDMEDLKSVFLDEFPELCAQEEVPFDLPSAKMNFEFVNEVMQPQDSALDGLVPLFMGENWEWVGQEENYMVCLTDEVYPHSMNHIGIGSIESTSEGSDELGELDVPNVIPSAPLMAGCMLNHMTPNLDISTAQESSDIVLELIQNGEIDLLFDEDSLVSQDLGVDHSELDVQKLVPFMPSMLEDVTVHMTPNLDNSAVGESSGMVSELIYNNEQSSLPERDIQVLESLNTSKNFEMDVQTVVPAGPSTAEVSFHVAENMDIPTDGENISEMMSELVQIEGQISLQEEEDIQNVEWNFWSGSLVAPASVASEKSGFGNDNQILESELEVSSERQYLGSAQNFRTSATKDHNGSKLWSFWSGNMGMESSVCSSLSDAEFISDSENKTCGTSVQSPPLSSIKKPFVSPLVTSNEKSASCIWSNRGILRSSPILTARSEGKNVRSYQKNGNHEPLSRALFNDEHNVEEEEEIFTPDKENFTPNTHRSIRKSALLKDLTNQSSGKSPNLKISGAPEAYYGDMSFSSDKENCSTGTLLMQKTASRASVNKGKSVRLRERNKGERVPFHSLLADLPQNSAPATCFPDGAMTKDNIFSERIQKWCMMVDTTTMLNKQSRIALQLLEGLKRTQLIIPKIVINDLACLKRQTTFFRRNTEVSSALDWIEDCMSKTQQWVHVQNSMEEGRPVAPTPPASPYSQASCGTTVGPFFFPSAFETQPELLSPTVEDHVLDYALSFRKNKNDGQLILLSNDVTLKIKAMAEDIICETAEEFRESLVNPFSERFLWADSSPRGQTWSCRDDFVLRERFYPSSLKMTPTAMENVKGLKLILLHNSQYFKGMSDN